MWWDVRIKCWERVVKRSQVQRSRVPEIKISRGEAHIQMILTQSVVSRDSFDVSEVRL